LTLLEARKPSSRPVFDERLDAVDKRRNRMNARTLADYLGLSAATVLDKFERGDPPGFQDRPCGSVPSV
jgi:hypothetical protein